MAGRRMNKISPIRVILPADPVETVMFSYFGNFGESPPVPSEEVRDRESTDYSKT